MRISFYIAISSYALRVMPSVWGSLSPSIEKLGHFFSLLSCLFCCLFVYFALGMFVWLLLAHKIPIGNKLVNPCGSITLIKCSKIMNICGSTAHNCTALGLFSSVCVRALQPPKPRDRDMGQTCMIPCRSITLIRWSNVQMFKCIATSLQCVHHQSLKIVIGDKLVWFHAGQ